MLSDLKHETKFLLLGASVDALLHHTAPVLVAGYFNTFLDHCFVNELVVIRFPSEENLLNDVIAIDVLGQVLYSFLQITGQELYLIRLLHDLYDLLD